MMERPDERPVVVTLAAPSPQVAPAPGWVEQLKKADEATKGNQDQGSAERVSASIPQVEQTPAEEAPPAMEESAEEALAASDLVPDPTTAAIEVEQPAVNREPIPWLEQYRSAYIDRQIALSDVTVQLANPKVGVYVEDYRAFGEEAGTPHQTWLATRDMQAVSPSVEALLLGRSSERLGQLPTFTCDPSKYACQSLPSAALGAYYRFAPLGSARTVQLVGVLYYDPSVRSATTNSRIGAFNRTIDAQLSRVE